MTPAPSSTYEASSGEAYERFLGRWTRRLADAVAEFAAVPETGDILDIGCGTGSLTFVLSDRRPGQRVVGIDIAAPYVEFAQARSRGRSIAFEIGDATRLRWADGSFGASCAQLVLNFIPEPDRAAREMRRVTRSGGVLVAAVWDFRGGLVYQRILWDTIAMLDADAAATRERLFGHPLALPNGLVDLWHRIGLERVQRDSATIRMEFADFDDYWLPLLGGQGPVGAYIKGSSPGMLQAARDSVRSAYQAGGSDGPRSLTATAWIVRGVVP